MTTLHSCPQWLYASVLLIGIGALNSPPQMAPQIAPQQGEMDQQAPAQRRQRSPIAMAALSSGQITILGSRGGLTLIKPANGQQTPIKTSLGNFTPIDMTSARIGNADFLFVTMYWAFSSQSSQGNEGVIVEYSLDGQEVKKWTTLGRTYAGIVVDPTHETIYLGSPHNGDISALAFSEQTPKTTVHVSGASLIGAVALDVEGQRLFAADLASSNVYVVDLVRRKSRLLASGLGEPSALSYDPSQHKLFIADAGRHRISQISVDTPNPKVSDFSTAPELREPRGVAVAPDHSVWATDFEAGTVLQFSSTGKVIATFRP
jgi:DNA-binding beta-propeller fold protein YncE